MSVSSMRRSGRSRVRVGERLVKWYRYPVARSGNSCLLWDASPGRWEAMAPCCISHMTPSYTYTASSIV